MPHELADPDPDQDLPGTEGPVAAGGPGGSPAAEGGGAGILPGSAEEGSPSGEPPSSETSVVEEETLRQQLRDASGAAFRRVEQSAPPGVRVRMRAFRERIRARRTLDTVWRVAVFALGVTLLVAGAVMMIIPGPGWATLILGLVVLGSEFTWATRALNPVKEAAKRASAVALDPRRRRRNLIIGATLGVLIGLVVWWYLSVYGVTFDPIMAWIEQLIPW